MTATGVGSTALLGSFIFITVSGIKDASMNQIFLRINSSFRSGNENLDRTVSISCLSFSLLNGQIRVGSYQFERVSIIAFVGLNQFKHVSIFVTVGSDLSSNVSRYSEPLV